MWETRRETFLTELKRHSRHSPGARTACFTS
jgi:hypothetical protein